MYITLSFIVVTFLVILLVEKLTYRVVGVVFKRHIKEMEKMEQEVVEYQELMILSMIAKDKEAYKGLNRIADEIYWKIFFRKLIIFSTSFFLLFSPYIIFTSYFMSSYIKNIVGMEFIIAISYFMFKSIYQYIKHVLEAKREYQNAKKREIV